MMLSLFRELTEIRLLKWRTSSHDLLEFRCVVITHLFRKFVCFFYPFRRSAFSLYLLRFFCLFRKQMQSNFASPAKSTSYSLPLPLLFRNFAAPWSSSFHLPFPPFHLPSPRRKGMIRQTYGALIRMRLTFRDLPNYDFNSNFDAFIV